MWRALQTLFSFLRGIMGLPTGRNTTYASGTQIESNDANDIQDCIVGGKHGEITMELSAACGVAAVASGWVFLPTLPASGNASYWDGSGVGVANYTVHFSLPLHVGDRIKAVRACIGDTAGTHKLNLRVAKDHITAGSSAEIGSYDQSVGDASVQTLEVGSLTETVAAGYAYSAIIETNDTTTTTHKVFGVEVDYDHP